MASASPRRVDNLGLKSISALVYLFLYDPILILIISAVGTSVTTKGVSIK